MVSVDHAYTGIDYVQHLCNSQQLLTKNFGQIHLITYRALQGNVPSSFQPDYETQLKYSNHLSQPAYYLINWITSKTQASATLS